jgi:hypothetical protein
VPGPPPSWVPALAVPRERMDLRCPRGGKLVLYARAQAELFAWFGECARWDGMVQRVTVFEARAGAAPPPLLFGPLHHAPALAHSPLWRRSRRRWSHMPASRSQQSSRRAVTVQSQAAVPTSGGDPTRPKSGLLEPARVRALGSARTLCGSRARRSPRGSPAPRPRRGAGRRADARARGARAVLPPARPAARAPLAPPRERRAGGLWCARAPGPRRLWCSALRRVCPGALLLHGPPPSGSPQLHTPVHGTRDKTERLTCRRA